MVYNDSAYSRFVLSPIQSPCMRHLSPLLTAYHYENLPMQYTVIFKVVKNENDIFLIFAQNIDCGYTLEPPRRGGSNEYPQSMF